jgi:hypothetical protein
LVDGHVHIHPCYEIDRVFNGAWRHFRMVADSYGTADFQGVLILTESAGDQAFDDLFHCTRRTVGRWYVLETGERHSLSLHRDDGARVLLVAGRQLVSQENLELSAYFITETIADGAPLTTLLEQVHRLGGLAVLPWGVGKWFGKRGHKVEEAIKHNGVPLMLSDNGGRPWFWPMPRLLHLARQQSVPVLAGTDPLPTVSEQQQAGRVGFVLRGALRSKLPAQDLQQRLLSLHESPLHYGKREGTWGFVRNQLYMRMRRVG